MAVEAMRKLNPLGGYSKIKYHLKVAHQISGPQAKMLAIITGDISDKVLYDYLTEEIRWDLALNSGGGERRGF